MGFVKNNSLDYTIKKILNLLSDKVNIEEGKVLTTNDFTDEYREMLESLNLKVNELTEYLDENNVSLLSARNA